MSGIVARFEFDGASCRPEFLDAMCTAMPHRSTAGIARHTDGAFAAARLCSDPRHPAVRHHLRADKLIIATDARIDNQVELRERLGLRPSASEVDLIAEAWRRWGIEFLTRIEGDFSLVLFDTATRTLVAARDRFGVRPLYYHLDGRSASFASEIGALRRLPRVGETINERRVAEYIVTLHEDVEETFLAGVQRVAPGSWLRIGPGGVQRGRYWQLEPGEGVRLASQEEYDEGFRTRFIRAVDRRVDSPAGIGSALSGGLDSTAVAMAARHLLEPRGIELHTFSAVFDDVPESDERPYIDDATALPGVVPHMIAGDHLRPLGESDRLLCVDDEPLLGPNAFISDAVYRAARSAGVGIIFEGFDGDIVISHGTARLAELARAGHLLTAWGEARRLGARFSVTPCGIFWRRAVRPLIPESVRTLRRRIGQHAVSELRRTLIHPEMIGRYDLECRVELSVAQRRRRSTSSVLDHLEGLRTPVVSLGLELLERTAARAGVDVRVPFFDRDLVEYCVALPSSQKLHDGYSRYIMRHALGGILPESVRWRGGKSSLGPNFFHVFSTYESDRVQRMVLGAPEAIAPYFDVDGLRAAALRLLRGEASGGDMVVLWKALVLDCWVRSVATTAGTGVA